MYILLGLIKEMKQRGYNGMYSTLNKKEVKKLESKGYEVKHVKAMNHHIEWTDEQNVYIEGQ